MNDFAVAPSTPSSSPEFADVTRQRCFEASHRYWVAEWSPEENWRRFGPCTSPFGHGHNYAVEVCVRAPIDERIGLSIDVAEVDHALGLVVDRFDHRFINGEVAEFRSGAFQPCVETLASVFRAEVARLLRERGAGDAIAVIAARVAEDETLAGTCEVEPMIRAKSGGRLDAALTTGRAGEPDARAPEVVSLERSYTFSAAHRLHSLELTDEENRSIFGKCNNPFGHGHSYVLKVTISGTPDRRTGMVVDLVALDRVVEEYVLQKIDHRHLNHEVPPFNVVNPTSENLARVIWHWLSPVCPGTLSALTIHETPRSRFTIRRPGT